MARASAKKEDRVKAATDAIYRFILLGIIFAVLWVKEYLWSAFALAFILLVVDAIVLPVISMGTVVDAPPQRARRSASGMDAEGPGDESFREPKPRWAPRTKGP